MKAVFNIFVILLLHTIYLGRVTSDVPEPSDKNPEHNEGLDGGDMIHLVGRDGLDGKGVGSRPLSHRWPGGVVPYEFAANISANHSILIVEQMRAIEDLTRVGNRLCVQFRQKHEADRYYITIFNGTGCYATVGFGDEDVTSRYLSLMHGPNGTCMRAGIIQHEMTHVLGLYHEQSRPDRDLYVSIQWDNIRPANAHNFAKYNETLVDTLKTSYDYGSLMHYSAYDFAINRSLPTIITLKNTSVEIGQRVQLSPIDITEIQRYYGCIPAPSVSARHALQSGILFSISFIYLFNIVN